MKLEKKQPVSASPRIQPETAEWLKYSFGSTNKGATFICDLFPDAYHRTMLKEIKGVFSQGELGVILDLMNGTILDPASMAGQWILPNLEDAFFLDPGMYEEKWEIKDSTDMVRRFKALTIFQKICMEVWVSRFWENCDDINLQEYLTDLTS